ncbi:MAG: hypothetical protein J0L99_19200 [Chitinophagales bacterium]|nr:hypothetical protein [Chitinophagales bacterium]
MNKNQKNKSSETSSLLQGWSNLKKTIVGVGVLGLIGLLADVLGLISFFDDGEPKVNNQTNITNPDNSVNKTEIYDHSVNSTIVKNNTNFIDKSTYICEVTNQVIVSASAPVEGNNDKSSLIKAANYFCENKNTLAYEYISRYDEPPSGIDPVAFYTLKGNIIFFENNYDLAYQYLLKAFYIDKKSKYLDLPKLRGLTYAYGHIRMAGYTLKDLKGIEMLNNDEIIYDIGSRKINAYNGWMLVNENETKEDRELIQLMNELGMDHKKFSTN